MQGMEALEAQVRDEELEFCKGVMAQPDLPAGTTINACVSCPDAIDMLARVGAFICKPMLTGAAYLHAAERAYCRMAVHGVGMGEDEDMLPAQALELARCQNTPDA